MNCLRAAAIITNVCNECFNQRSDDKTAERGVSECLIGSVKISGQSVLCATIDAGVMLFAFS